MFDAFLVFRDGLVFRERGVGDLGMFSESIGWFHCTLGRGFYRGFLVSVRVFHGWP